MALHSPMRRNICWPLANSFATERWDCYKTTFIESDPQHFQVIVILEGQGKFYDSEMAFDYKPGQTWFFPASLPVTMIQPSSQTSLMRIFVPEIESLRQQLRNQGFDEKALSKVLVG